MGIGTTKNLGSLKLGGVLFESASMTADGSTERDIYKFRIEDGPANVSISTGLVTTSPFGLALFQDKNNSGVLDNGDSLLRVSDKGSGNFESTETINTILSSGTYFARTQAFALNDFKYIFSASRLTAGAANPLATPEIPLGTIAQDLQRRDRVNDKDTADNFAFTLDGTSSLNIGVRELGNKKGDVNIRVVQDLNGNGSVDKNEVVVKGVSTLKGDVETITGLNKVGDYVLQVCQTKGNTQFEVNFNPSVA